MSKEGGGKLFKLLRFHYSTYYCIEIITESVKAVIMIKDDGFLLPTPGAKEALHLATRLLEWIESNRRSPLLENFCSSLCATFTARIASTKTSTKVDRTKLWQLYNEVITCQQFEDSWDRFLRTAIKSSYSPMFCMFVSQKVHDRLLKESLPIEHSLSQSTSELAPSELHALRYAAGYVIRRMKKRFGEDFDEFNFTCCDDDTYEPSQDWVDKVDRGGLVHVNSRTFAFFHAMEVELRRYFNTSNITHQSKSSDIVALIMGDVDVRSAWVDISEHLQEKLLTDIIALYVTMRGFSYTDSWMEMYKQVSKQCLGKSKGLRKKIST